MYYIQVYLTCEKCIKFSYSEGLHCKECALKHGCFITQYPSDAAKYSTQPARSLPIESGIVHVQDLMDFHSRLCCELRVFYLTIS